ncbi:ATP-binding protein [Salinarchaeum laminariae]|uniref:ATP-binding protein n=1 Tax=Salinarchaeum laminariae TaxID=869888 RepID=UPI0020BE9508|nr:ATP-binding protein [Salinarchaeum laminariae]
MAVRPGTVGLIAADANRAKTLESVLAAEGHTVRCATNLEDTRKLVTEHVIDCVALCGGPELDTIDVLEAVTDLDSLLPIVCCPNDGSEALAATVLEFDVEAYVPRSAGQEAVVDAIGTACQAGSEPLRDAEGMLRSLTGMVPISLSIYFKDREGRHVHVSDHFPGLIGTPYMETPDGKILHTPEDVIGMTDFDIYGSELALQTIEDEQEIMETGEPVINQIEPAEVADDEQDYYVSTTKAPWYDSTGRLRGIVGVTIDVTERERNRRALSRQNDRLERFASVLSHDLRNPLGIAKGRVRELDGDSGAKDDVTWALERMDELITEVLELARQGAVVDDPKPVSLSDPVFAAWETVGGGGSLECEALPTVSGDEKRLRALFENLFHNALQHGGEDVTVSVTHQDDTLVIEDDGPGVPDDQRDEIFDHGFTTNEDGTGFGLSIVREIVEAHGWQIRVEPSDCGARFVIEDAIDPS